jgi:hypothetical protein
MKELNGESRESHGLKRRKKIAGAEGFHWEESRRVTRRHNLPSKILMKAIRICY